MQAYFSSKTPSGLEVEAIGQALAQVQALTTSRLRRPAIRSHAKSVDFSHQTQRKLLKTQLKSRDQPPSRLDFNNPSIEHPQKTTVNSHTDRAPQSNSKLTTCEDDNPRDTSRNHIHILRKLQREKQNRSKIMQLDLKKVQKRRENEESRRKKLENERKTQEKEAVLEELKRKQEKREERQRERELMKAETDQKLREIQRNTPLYASLESRYRSRVLLPELDRQASILHHRREAVSLDSLRNHSADFHRHEVSSEINRIQARKQRQRDISRFQRQISGFYRSKIADVLEYEEVKTREKEIKSEQAGREKFLRLKEYGNLVKELFKPRISRVKQLQMQLSRQELEYKPRPVVTQPRLQVKRRIRVKSVGSVSTVSEPVMRKSVNYLEEMKNRRKNRAKTGMSLAGRFEKWVEAADSVKNIPKVQAELQKLENWAKSRESMLEEMSWKEGVQAREDVSALYIDSIRTKLALLSHFS